MIRSKPSDSFMAFFDNLFGKKAMPPPFKPDPVATQVPPPRNTSKSNEMIKAFDAYGREIQITREEWRTKVLPGQFQQNWTNPEGLATCITQALQDGFPEEAL